MKQVCRLVLIHLCTVFTDRLTTFGVQKFDFRLIFVTFDVLMCSRFVNVSEFCSVIIL